MFVFILKMFIRLLSVSTTASFGRSLDSNLLGRMKYGSLNNRLCQARPTFVNINSNEPIYNSFTFSVNKCG